MDPLQRRTMRLLVAAQVFGGAGFGRLALLGGFLGAALVLVAIRAGRFAPAPPGLFGIRTQLAHHRELGLYDGFLFSDSSKRKDCKEERHGDHA